MQLGSYNNKFFVQDAIDVGYNYKKLLKREHGAIRGTRLYSRFVKREDYRPFHRTPRQNLKYVRRYKRFIFSERRKRLQTRKPGGYEAGKYTRTSRKYEGGPSMPRRRVYYGRTRRYSSKIPRGYRGRYRRSGYWGRMKGRTQELKFHDTDQLDGTVSATGTVTNSWNLIAQGTTEKLRIGRKAILRSITARWIVALPINQDVADISAGEIVRIIVFCDKQCNGANAAVLDILETAEVESYYNLVNLGRFQILYDRKITLNRQVAVTDGTNTSTSPAFRREMHFHRKLNVPIEFDNTAGAISEIRSNNIAALYISHAGVAAIEVGRVRIRFDG